jgi:hypothetical protein
MLKHHLNQWRCDQILVQGTQLVFTCGFNEKIYGTVSTFPTVAKGHPLRFKLWCMYAHNVQNRLYESITTDADYFDRVIAGKDDAGWFSHWKTDS